MSVVEITLVFENNAWNTLGNNRIGESFKSLVPIDKPFFPFLMDEVFKE